VGYDKVKGFLSGGVNAWKEAGLPVKSVHSVTAEEFAKNIEKEGQPLDVRNDGEVMNGSVRDALTIPLGKLSEKLNSLDKNIHYYVYCAGGYRSMISSSILEKAGFTNITNVEGGINAIKKTGVKIDVPEPA
jgi:hydroxyacylglutathione hydrolase